MEKEQKCWFCGCLIGEGFKHQELYVCIECWTLLNTIIENALPIIMHEVSEKVETTIKDKSLQPYHYEEKESK